MTRLNLKLTLTPVSGIDITTLGAPDVNLVSVLTPFYVGATGPPNAAVETSVTATTSQVVSHNLGYRPIVQVVDNSGFVLDAQIQHINTNQFQVAFNAAQSGTIIYL